jgi:hypothetical protein
LIKYTDDTLSNAFEAWAEYVDFTTQLRYALFGRNVDFSRIENDVAYYDPVLPSLGTWAQGLYEMPVVHAGPGRWSKTSNVFSVTPSADFRAYGWVAVLDDDSTVRFGEPWPGGVLLKAGVVFKFQIVIVMSDGCPSCIC